MGVLRTQKVRLGLALLFAGFVAYFVFATVSLALMRSVFARVQIAPALMAVFVYILLTFVRAWRFKIAGAPSSLSTLFRVAAIHAAMLRVMPLRSGELAYAFMLKRTASLGVTHGIATILLLRILDLIAILPLAGVAIFLWAAKVDVHWLLPGLVVAFALFVSMFFALGAICKSLSSRFFSRGAVGKNTRLGQMIETVVEVTGHPHSTRFALLGVTLILWATVLVWFYFSLSAFHAVDTFGDGVRVGILGVTGSILPISLIGSFGPMEGGIALGLGAVGQSADVATANAIVVSGLTFLANWIIATPCLVAEVFLHRGRH